MTQKTAEQAKNDAMATMQEYFPNGGRDWDNASALFDAIRDGKVAGLFVSQVQAQVIPLNPPRAEMIEYLRTAIGEGYQPEHEATITEPSLIDGLDSESLNREFGKCWQRYNMGGGWHETFQKQESFKEAAKPLIKWLAENVHPHHTAIITSTGAELMMGEMSFPTEEFLKD
ncbi:hypothetical protein [Yersinia rohdei]|uniref:hypothetical protein n=1 Tax=Yersinia rohdei TaxID=29485 RepID=UPI0021BD9ED4|nr:hypothetical protein [Yersinia rohdei]